MLVVILLASSATTSALAQIITEKQFPQLPPKPLKQPVQSQIQAWESFSQEHPGWNIRWNDATGTPASLLGSPITYKGATPQEIALNIIKDNAQLFIATDIHSNLNIVEVFNTKYATHVRFQQTHDNIPIEDARYAVHMTRDNQVYFVNGDYYNDVEVQTIVPTTPFAEAVQVVLSDVGGAEVEVLKVTSEELVILPYGSEYKLCWKVDLATVKPYGKWVYYVSSDDGSILKVNDKIHRDGPIPKDIVQVEVYAHDPGEDDENPTTINTIYVDTPGETLESPFLRVENEEGAEVYETDGTFFYEPDDSHFDEVMVYYHAYVKFLKDFLWWELEYDIYRFLTDHGQITAKVHYPRNGIWGFSYADWDSKELRFCDGGFIYIPGLGAVVANDFAKESDVIYHEYMHLVTRDLVGGLLYDEGEERAMNEAYSDFMACSFDDNPRFEEYVVTGISGNSYRRTCDNTYTMEAPRYFVWVNESSNLPAMR